MLKQLEALHQDTIRRVVEIVGDELQDCIRVEIALYTSDSLNENKMKDLFFDETIIPGGDNADDVICYWSKNAANPEGNGGVVFYLKW